MKKMNCWEHKNCGREPNGAKAKELGICPASIERSTTGVNSGKNGGRACWAITGTLCGGVAQGTFTSKVGSCMKCEFYHKVGIEEGSAYQSTRDILTLLKMN